CQSVFQRCEWTAQVSLRSVLPQEFHLWRANVHPKGVRRKKPDLLFCDLRGDSPDAGFDSILYGSHREAAEWRLFRTAGFRLQLSALRSIQPETCGEWAGKLYPACREPRSPESAKFHRHGLAPILAAAEPGRQPGRLEQLVLQPERSEQP